MISYIVQFVGINFLHQTAQQILIATVLVLIDEVLDNILSNVGSPLLDIFLVLPRELKQPRKKVTCPPCVDFPKNPKRSKFRK